MEIITHQEGILDRFQKQEGVVLALEDLKARGLWLDKLPSTAILLRRNTSTMVTHQPLMFSTTGKVRLTDSKKKLRI